LESTEAPIRDTLLTLIEGLDSMSPKQQKWR